jgi:hypothetical protein
MLRGWARQAKEHPHSLAHLLTGYPIAALCQRLGCDEQTAYWLQLYGVPCRQRWDHEVAAMAKDLEIDASRLGAFLRDVTAVGDENGETRPSPVSGFVPHRAGSAPAPEGAG